MKVLKALVLLLFWGCQNNTKELPVLSYNIDSDGHKAYYSISYQGFTNQLNTGFSTKHIDNKVSIANFFFTRCPSICPPMRIKLIEIAKTFEDHDDFLIISHTIDPEHDSIPVLKSYSESTGIPNNSWQFLHADVEKTKAQANQFMTRFAPTKDGTDFYHSSYVALVDKKRAIRGFYNILVNEDLERLKNDISFLLSR